MQQDGSYFMNIAGGQVTFANPNFAAALAFLSAHEEMILFPLFLLTLGVISFTAIWRGTRDERAKAPAAVPDPWRMFTVTLGDATVFETLACDVDLDDEPVAHLNFLGQRIDEDTRVSVAVLPWLPEYKVQSRPADAVPDTVKEGAR